MVLLGNFSIIGIIVTDPRLNIPMYLFLGNLSVIDLSYSTVTVPKAMANIWSWKTVSFVCCVAQLFLYAIFMVTEAFVLAEGWIFLLKDNLRVCTHISNVSNNRAANSNHSAFNVFWTDIWEFCEHGNLEPKSVRYWTSVLVQLAMPFTLSCNSSSF